MDAESSAESNRHSGSLRQRRRLGHSKREKTPDPGSKSMSNGRRRYDDDDELETTADLEERGRGRQLEHAGAQVVSMQIRAPGAMSAHESKILRRRDKTFATAAARSHSQPREAEKLTSPDVYQLLQTAAKQRSLSTPRHKDESSESEVVTGTLPRIALETNNENLSRMELNMRRFEDERKRFEAEKRLFEREKREHKARHRQLLDNEERKRLLASYRKLSDRIQLPADEEDRRRLVHSLRLQRHEAPHLRKRSSGYDESSTQFSSSDADTAAENELVSRSRAARNSGVYVMSSVRGAPPQPPTMTAAPPKEPERKSVSRNSSLSPIRPQRRSKTPEQRAEVMRKYAEKDEVDAAPKLNEQQQQEGSYATIGEMGTGQLQEPKAKLSEEAQRAELMRRYAEAAEKMAEFEFKYGAEKEKPKENEVNDVELRRRSSMRQEEKPKTPKLETKRSTSLERPLRPKREKSIERTPIVKLEAEATATAAAEVPSDKPVESLENKVPNDDTNEIVQPNLFEKFKNYFKRNKQLTKADLVPETSQELIEAELPETIFSCAFLQLLRLDTRQQWQRLKADYPLELLQMQKLRNKCIVHCIMLILLCGFGGLMFRYTEGTAENIYKCEVRKVKRDFIDNLWSGSHNMREDDWKSLARHKLRTFEEELSTLSELGLRRIPGQKSWNFVNCILYCWTVVTTIGYGHITPKTDAGRLLTIIYAIIGIPMFLIILADFGKLFTRCIKFLWAYVRRLYYTGTCRSIRKQQHVRDAMSGINTMYDMAIRRPSMFFSMSGTPTDIESQSEAAKSMSASHPETPISPYQETFKVDDEFNLPVSLASMLLIGYILMGAFVFKVLEHRGWSYMDSIYFVFISMSTIGFGDLVPSSPLLMMASMIYLMFGLALTSMFINVVQIKLSEHFKVATAKISATIGLGLASEMGDGDADGSQLKTPSELASVHGSRLGQIAEDEHEAQINGSGGNTSPQLTSILRPARPVSPAYDRIQRDDDVAGNTNGTISPPPPPLLPKRYVEPQPPETEKKKKRRFFK